MCVRMVEVAEAVIGTGNEPMSSSFDRTCQQHFDREFCCYCCFGLKKSPVTRTMTDAAVDDSTTIHFDTKMMTPVWTGKRTKSKTPVVVKTTKQAEFVNVVCTCSNYYCSTLTVMAAAVVVIGPESEKSN